jgi:hypothetical protein
LPYRHKSPCLVYQAFDKHRVALLNFLVFPYIYITNDKHPKVGFYRGTRHKNYQFFGPYPSAHVVRDSLNLLKKIFKVARGKITSPHVMFKHLAYNCAFANHQRLLYLMVLIFFKEITKVNKLMRKTFLSADGYKYFNINRKDVEQKTARYNQAHVVEQKIISVRIVIMRCIIYIFNLGCKYIQPYNCI